MVHAYHSSNYNSVMKIHVPDYTIPELNEHTK